MQVASHGNDLLHWQETQCSSVTAQVQVLRPTGPLWARAGGKAVRAAREFWCSLEDAHVRAPGAVASPGACAERCEADHKAEEAAGKGQGNALQGVLVQHL
mmetsp:Transcript_49048/g.136328  ORF Transcript_49048/g.136328 Transcript_49048/m.136328 type:complete len:101 (+) Transcript_49048:27-329(+)